MKRYLIIIFISLLFSHTSNAKLSSEAWNDVYGGCFNNSEKTKFFNQYCTCFVNEYDAIFSDEELDRYLRTTKDVQKDPLFKKITQQCYDKYK